jgi:hypothetical protein
MQKVDEDAGWYDKPVQQQRADVYALAAIKMAQIQAGLVPLMDDVDDTSSPDDQV